MPYTLTHEATGAQLLCLPYCMETNDFSLVLTRHHTPRQYAEAVEDHVAQLAAEARPPRPAAVVCLGMHTFVAGTPGHVRALEATLERLKQTPGVAFATAAEVCAAAAAAAATAGDAAFAMGLSRD